MSRIICELVAEAEAERDDAAADLRAKHKDVKARETALLLAERKSKTSAEAGLCFIHKPRQRRRYQQQRRRRRQQQQRRQQQRRRQQQQQWHQKQLPRGGRQQHHQQRCGPDF